MMCVQMTMLSQLQEGIHKTVECELENGLLMLGTPVGR